MAGEYRWHILNESLAAGKRRLILLLGGVCESCGEEELLEIHHRNGKTWRSNKLSRPQRLKHYEQDIIAGECFLLCKWCHDNPDDHPDYCFCPKCREQSDF